MNKYVKGFLIGALVLVVLGTIVFAGGAAAGGMSKASGVIRGAFDRYDDIDDVREEKRESGTDDDDDDWILQEHHGDVEFSADEVKNLEIDVSAADITIMEDGDTDRITVSIKNQCAGAEMKGGLLKIGSLSRCREGEREQIVMKVPSDFYFNEVDVSANAAAMDIASINARSLEIELDAGVVEIERLKAEEADFGIGAGEITVRDGNVRSCDVEVATGCFVYKGMIYDGSGYAECGVDCQMGSVEFDLQGSEDDYNYEVECAAGSVIIGNETFSGLTREKLIDHHAGADFEIDCSMGEVKVVF